MRPQIAPDTMRQFTQISRWKSLALCIAIYIAAIALAWLGGRGSGWLLAIPAFILIGALQNHLYILLHEGAHVLLHPNRKMNDLIADIFCAVPFFTLEKNYRIFHLTHHKFASSPERDPEVMLYANQGYFYSRRNLKGVIKMLLFDFSGVNFLKFASKLTAFLKEEEKAGRLRHQMPRDPLLMIGFWGGVGLSSIYFGFWPEFIVFWILPQATILFFLLKLHGYGEHTGATGPTEYQRTWVHDFNPVTDFFIYPIYSGYHLEHHFFPRVPWYHMKRFRQMLLDTTDYGEKSQPVTVTGYFIGERTILKAMLLGEGEYRSQTLHAETKEIKGDVIGLDTKGEVDEQLVNETA